MEEVLLDSTPKLDDVSLIKTTSNPYQEEVSPALLDDVPLN